MSDLSAVIGNSLTTPNDLGSVLQEARQVSSEAQAIVDEARTGIAPEASAIPKLQGNPKSAGGSNIMLIVIGAAVLFLFVLRK